MAANTTSAQLSAQPLTASPQALPLDGYSRWQNLKTFVHSRASQSDCVKSPAVFHGAFNSDRSAVSRGRTVRSIAGSPIPQTTGRCLTPPARMEPRENPNLSEGAVKLSDRLSSSPHVPSRTGNFASIRFVKALNK